MSKMSNSKTPTSPSAKSDTRDTCDSSSCALYTTYDWGRQSPALVWNLAVIPGRTEYDDLKAAMDRACDAMDACPSVESSSSSFGDGVNCFVGTRREELRQAASAAKRDAFRKLLGLLMKHVDLATTSWRFVANSCAIAPDLAA